MSKVVNVGKGLAGQLTSNSSPFASESFILEKSDAPYGVVMVTDEDGVCRLPDKDNALKKGASTGFAVGVLILEKLNKIPCNAPLVLPIGNGETNYAKEKQVVTVAKEGNIFVKTETDVKRNDPVFYRVAKTATTALGAMRKDADTDKAVKLNGAVFGATAKAGEVVEVFLNLTAVQESY